MVERSRASANHGTLPWSWKIGLVRPRNPLNIGAAARAMANFGFRELFLVSPYEPSWREARSAVGAAEVIRSAPVVDRLAEGVADCTLVIGTTCGARRHLERPLIPLDEFGGWLEEWARAKRGRRPMGAGARRAALLFGSEKTGLSNEEMSYCRALVRIPTAPDCPSMNLGQAVAVCCYELGRRGLAGRRPPGLRVRASEPASLQALDHVFERVVRVLEQVGYLPAKSRAATVVKLRRWLLDLRLTHYDVRILGGVLAQVEWKLKTLQ